MIRFTKMTGAGNDFVLIDNRLSEYSYDWSALAPKICDRKFGVGADGLLVLAPSIKADFMMLYYNADGSYGGMCGNGGRCAAGFVMDEKKLIKITFEALDYIYEANILQEHIIQLLMKNASDIRTDIRIDALNTYIEMNFINTGSPHAVIFFDQLPDVLKSEISNEGIGRIGKEIRNHPLFKPEGTNVNFVSVTGSDTIAMRTYERGVEDETLACGTGSVASAIISSLKRGTLHPVNIITRSNKVLRVSFKIDGKSVTEVTLEGPAEKVFTGVYEVI